MTQHRLTKSLPGPARTFRLCAALLLALLTLLAAGPPAAPVAAQEDESTAQVTINVFACPEDVDPASGIDILLGICTEPAGDLTFTWGDAAGTLQTLTTQNGQVVIAGIAEGSYTLYSDVPQDVATEVASCIADGGNRYTREFDESGVTAFDPIKREQIVCDWFVIPTQVGMSAPPALTGSLRLQPEDPSEDPSEDMAQVSINTVLCPAGTDAASAFDALNAVCDGAVEDVTFTWQDAAGATTTFTTSGTDPIVIDGIEEGSYTLYSGIPLEFASEALYCVADGGNRYQKEFNDTGVTAFDPIKREQIVCDWFVIPFDLQGEETPTPPVESGLAGDPVVTPTPEPSTPEHTVAPATGGELVRALETGASLTVHLALCPPEYSGDQLFDDCHGAGISDQTFTLTGPSGELEQVTTVPQTPGPGIVQFLSLPAGDYTIAGGPPGDFGTVRLYCSIQPDGDRVDAALDSTRASLTIGDGEDVLCDWYYIPDNQGEETPTPAPTATQEPEDRAEILVTLYECAPGTTVAGASYADLLGACDDTRNGVPFTLGDVGAPPLTANTGVSGAGAVRFYELLPADYTLRPTLPDGLGSVAVYCQLNGGDPYQKTLDDGATTFVDVDGDAITCAWYALRANPTPDPEPQGPSGSVTVREYICGEDQSAIVDWEQECDAGASGATFTLASTDGAITRSSRTDDAGVAVFSDLPDGIYTLNQDEGMWCRARAERVDSQSRVIVEGGQNTDVFLYQCTDVTQLPSTGTGPGIGPMDGDATPATVSAVQWSLMGAGVIGGAILLAWSVARRPRMDRCS